MASLIAASHFRLIAESSSHHSDDRRLHVNDHRIIRQRRREKRSAMPAFETHVTLHACQRREYRLGLVCDWPQPDVLGHDDADGPLALRSAHCTWPFLSVSTSVSSRY